MADPTNNYGPAPWELLAYYQTPTEKTILVSSSPVQLVKSNVQRKAIVFGNASGIAFAITTNPAGVAGSNGLQITPQQSPVVISVESHGILATLAWYGMSTSINTPVTVFEILLNSWPGEGDVQSLIAEVDSGKYQGRIVRPTNGVGRSRVYGNRWGKRQAQAPYGLPDFGNPNLP